VHRAPEQVALAGVGVEVAFAIEQRGEVLGADVGALREQDRVAAGRGVDEVEADRNEGEQREDDEVQAAVLAQTRNIPAGLSLQEAGIDYGDAPEQVKAALAAFVSAVPEFSPVVYELQGYRNNRAIFNATPARLTQAIVGELSVDEALERLDADVAEAVAAAN